MLTLPTAHPTFLDTSLDILPRNLAMNQPIPSNSSEPLKVGDRVRILPEWQNNGDEQFEHVVVEAMGDCSRVLIRTIIPGGLLEPTERIEARMLEFLTPGPQFDSALNYVEGDQRVLIRNARGDYLARDGTWKADRRQASTYFMSADKVAEQLEEADKLYGVKLVVEELPP